MVIALGEIQNMSKRRAADAHISQITKQSQFSRMQLKTRGQTGIPIGGRGLLGVFAAWRETGLAPEPHIKMTKQSQFSLRRSMKPQDSALGLRPGGLASMAPDHPDSPS